MYSTSVILSNLDQTYDISPLMQGKIDDIIKKLDDILGAAGYLNGDDDDDTP
jgi:hypothetical protein